MFADKQYLLFLFLIPAFIAFFYFAYGARKKVLSLFVRAENTAVLSNVRLKSYVIKYVFFMLGVLFLILALARPQYGYKKQKVARQSSEIIIALDISKSMLAQDITPNRLERAKLTLSKIVEDNAGQKIGVIAFAGAAMWQCPMTYDIDALKMFFKGINAASLPVNGTQISNAVNLAVKGSGKASASKTLILISDGEDHDSKISEAIAAAKAVNLKIVSVGIGTRQGAPIPIKDGNIVTGYIKDKKGNMVMSKLNSSILERIASETGGKYLEITGLKDVSFELNKIVKEAEKIKNEDIEKNAKFDRFRIFLFIAFLFLLMEILIPLNFKNKK